MKMNRKVLFQALGICILAAALIPGCRDVYTIRDYLADQAFVPVAGIAGIPDGAAMTAPLTLSPKVAPENATNRTVLWAVSDEGDTGAEISGNVFRAWAAGEAKITARIPEGIAKGQDFVQEFTLRVTEEFLPVEEIKRGFGKTVPSGEPLTLVGTVQPYWATNRTIGWSLVAGGTTNASLAGNVLTIPDGGDVTVRATVVNGK
ncbi:MAG: hypothetical protein LBR23_03325, partial [Spirochaetaceae bacterium]|nr:hypothetical protein [Spirochaetaceae bacterium]